MPIARLANASIVHDRRSLYELEDFAGRGARSEHGSYAHGVKRRSVVFGDDPAAENNHVIKACLNQFLAHLWEEVGVGP